MRPRNAWLTLGLQVAPSLPIPSRRKKLATEPAFEHPPLWIHASVAAKCFLTGEAERKAVSSKREAKRRALLELLDRIPVRAGDARPRKQPKEVTPRAADIQLASKAPQGQPLQNK